MSRLDCVPGRLWWSLSIIVWATFVGGGLARMRTNIEDVRPWLPDDTPERGDYDWFVETFGSDDMVIVSWDGCQLADSRVDALTAALRARDAHFIREVVSPTETLARVIDASRLSPQEAVDRLRGFLIGPDGETACLLLYLTTDGMGDRRSAVQAIMDRSLEVCDLSPAELHLGGRPYLGYYTSQVTLRSLIALSIPVAVLSTLLAWIALRDVGLLLVTLCSAGFAALTSLAMVPWCGFELSGVLTALPSLIYVVATSGAIHLANYAAELARGAHGTWDSLSPSARARAIRQKAWRPCLLSSASTGLGTLSLVWSQFPAIRDFGIFATIGVAGTFLVHLWLVPRLLAWHRPRHVTAADEPRLTRMMMSLLQVILRYRRLVLLATLGVTLLLAAPLFRLEGRFQISELFRPGSEFLRHAHWLEAHLGPIDATDVVLGYGPAEDATTLQRIQQVQELERLIAALPAVKSTYSAATMLPDLSSSQSVLSRLLLRAALQRRRASLVDGSLVASSAGQEYWRITLRTSLFEDPDREQLRRQIIQTVEDATGDEERPPSLLVTGATQVFEESKDEVLRDFIESLLLAYVLILGLMIVALRSIPGALLAMIPNVVPSVAVFGVLGWIDGAVDMGMTVAACIALGIAVDDTAHLLMSYRDARNAFPARRALEMAVRQCAPAMCQTSLICGVALIPYLGAELIYLARFGLLIPLLMAAALVGDLLLLPAILAGPLGRHFDPRGSVSTAADTTTGP